MKIKSAHAAVVIYGRVVEFDDTTPEELKGWRAELAKADPKLFLAAAGPTGDGEAFYGQGVVGLAHCVAETDGPDASKPVTVPALGAAPTISWANVEDLDLPWLEADEDDEDASPTEGWFLCPIGWSVATLTSDGEEHLTTSSEDGEPARWIDAAELEGKIELVAEYC